MAGDPAIRPPEPEIDRIAATKQQSTRATSLSAEFRHPDVCADAPARSLRLADVGVLRAMLVAVLAAIAFEVVFAPRAAHRALDPDEPIAADGSMIAGKARTDLRHKSAARRLRRTAAARP